MMLPIIDIFSKRQKILRGDTPDVYSYDCIPNPLRVQIVHIMYDALGNKEQYADGFPPGVRISYDNIEKIICREYGEFRLPGNYGRDQRNKMEDLINFFLGEEDINRVIDVIEVSFQVINRLARSRNYLRKDDPSRDADRAIDALNRRFKEHGVGYSFTNDKIIRIDSEFVHSEVVRPALGILNREGYSGAQQEFLSAHEHYQKGETKEALNECLKSLESTIKSICDKREWEYGEGDTARKLIDICFEKGLIPSLWETKFGALRTLLGSGVPPARNKLSGHGQGAAPKPVPDHISGYVLHMTAAAIVFLAEAEASDSKP